MFKRLQLFGSKENNQVKDPKTMVTPYAFKVADELLYIPLASPMRRGVAMAIDGLVVTVLADKAGPLFMLLLVAVFFYVRKHHDRLERWAKRIIYAILLLGMLWSVGNMVSSELPGKVNDKSVLPLSAAPILIQMASCEDIACAREHGNDLSQLFKKLEVSREEAGTILSGVIDELPLTAEEKGQLQGEFAPALLALSQATSDDNSTDVALGKQTQDGEQATPLLVKDDAGERDPYSVLGWLKGAMNDLGLGFGWAAFYFTAFTAWFDGQTLGKKLTGIRVISLAGKKLGFWDAFGRYGGYGAGFATGLMGFLQIYWDANRQAIQDKISGTVVIDLLRPRMIPETPGELGPLSTTPEPTAEQSADKQ
ncbi:RDD family protein [Shewanella sedimentimangrovi]|nr:RDD family protein [Shewanella sedimentimangrovi]